MREKARKLVFKYVNEHQDDLLRTWATERPFELYLDGVVVSGRADVIYDEHDGVPDNLAIVDYKTSTGGDDRAAPAAGLRRRRPPRGPHRRRGVHPRHEHDDPTRRSTSTTTRSRRPRQTVIAAAEALRQRDFTPKPGDVEVPRVRRADGVRRGEAQAERRRRGPGLLQRVPEPAGARRGRGRRRRDGPAPARRSGRSCAASSPTWSRVSTMNADLVARRHHAQPAGLQVERRRVGDAGQRVDRDHHRPLQALPSLGRVDPDLVRPRRRAQRRAPSS